jgi:thymidylate synthase (FAD)
MNCPSTTKSKCAYRIWEHGCESAETAYFDLLDYGCSPQEARTVLPNSLKTEVIMTANIQEWQHFIDLRTSSAAHPQMREVATQARDALLKELPLHFKSPDGDA